MTEDVMRRFNINGYDKGFTLIELMVTIAVASIAISIAVPAFTGLIESSKERAARDLLVSSIYAAKQQAQSKSVNVYLCATDDGSTCTSSWGSDWLVYEDNDGSTTLNADDIIVSKLTSKILEIQSTSAQISFTPTGHAIANTFRVCSNADQSIVYQIELSRMGRISYTTATGDC